MDLTSINPGLIILTVVGLALAPFVAVMVTSFTKIVVVLSLLRNALGLQQSPPNVVINGLALILSFYVMAPVLSVSMSAVQEQQGTQVEDRGWDMDRLIEVADAGKEPFRDFLVKHSSETERAFFLNTSRRMLGGGERAEEIGDRDFMVVIPAFTVSELTAAFQIGFLIFLPFIIIDLIVANILMALGMMMLSPTMVSLPFKLLLFVFIDGWSKLVHGLVLTYV